MDAHTLLAVLYFFVPAYLANMAPVVVRGYAEWLARPMDGGRTWRGRRLLGDHKTWRGLLAGIVVGALTFAAQRWLWQRGVAPDIAPGASWLGFDQLDFMFGAYACVAIVFVPPLLETIAILPLVFVGSIATTSAGYWLGWKEAWI
jgi:hypothetical protein